MSRKYIDYTLSFRKATNRIRQTLYGHVSIAATLREDGHKLFKIMRHNHCFKSTVFKLLHVANDGLCATLSDKPNAQKKGFSL